MGLSHTAEQGSELLHADEQGGRVYGVHDSDFAHSGLPLLPTFMESEYIKVSEK